MHIQYGQFSSFTSSDISSKMKNNVGLNASFQEFIHVRVNGADEITN